MARGTTVNERTLTRDQTYGFDGSTVPDNCTNCRGSKESQWSFSVEATDVRRPVGVTIDVWLDPLN